MTNKKERLDALSKAGVAVQVAKDMVAFWASTFDAHLQEFLSKGTDNDNLGFLLACVRMSQACSIASDDFKQMCEECLDSDTEAKACTQAAKTEARRIVDGINKIMPIPREGSNTGEKKEVKDVN